MPPSLSHWKLSNHLFEQSSLLSVCEVFISSRSSNVRRHVVHMQGDVAHNMYSVAAVYPRIFNQLIQIFH